ncbi:phage tail protein [Desulfovibrio sp. OttesenSCG-928-A18]|nr:phage tail protein [Desulfovibrio sp. OttesenSCG-928-A18]
MLNFGDDNYVLHEDWEKTSLQNGDLLVIAQIPMNGGGGSNPLQAVFAIAMMAAMIAVPQVGPFAVGSALAGWGGAAAAGIGLVGSLVSGMLFGTPSGQTGAFQAEQASPTYSINGTGNQARLGQVVPKGFGRMRIVPDIVAKQWTLYIGNEMYWHGVYGCGRGPYEQHSYTFGDVVFWEDGKLIESALTSEAGEQYTNTINVQIVAVADGGDWYGPYQATENDALTMNITVNFPDGLCTFYYYEDTNQETGEDISGWRAQNATASIEAEYREVGATEWLPLASATVTKATLSPFTQLLSGKAPGFGRWEVRVRNTSVIPDESTYTVGWQIYSTPNHKTVVLGNISSIGASISVQVTEPGGTVTLFPDNVEPSSNVASQELLAPNQAGHDWIGPFPINSPGTRISEAKYNFVFEGGLGRYNSSGKLRNHSVGIEIQHRAIDDYGNPIGEWETVLTKTYSEGTLTALRYTETIATEPGRYEGRVRRTSNKRTDNRGIETIKWEALVGIIPGSLTYDQTVVAIKIKATNVLSQAASNNFSVVQTAKLPLYDRQTKTWSEPVATRSWAAAISDVCKDVHGGGLTDKEIDLDTLWRIDEILQENGWYFDAWVDGAYKVWALLVEMCVGYRVAPRLVGTTLSFVYDQANRPVRHIFTPYDIVRGSFVPTYNTHDEDNPDHVVVEYLDEEVGYLQRDVPCQLSDGESEKAATIQYLGICNRDHAFKTGLFYAACNRWRRLGCEFETEGVGRLLNIGDVISLTHPTLESMVSGTFTWWDSKSLILQLDRDVASRIPEEAENLYMALNRPDGTPWGPVKLLWVDCDRARFDPEDYAVLMNQGLESPFEWLSVGNDQIPTVWTIQEGEEIPERYIITSLAPVSTYRYRVTCINDSDKINAYDALPTPPWEYRGELPNYDALPVPGNLRVGLTDDTTQGGLLSATWEEVPGATAYEIATSADGVNWTRYGRVNGNTVQIPVAYDAVWFRVATVRVSQQSSWVVWQGGFEISDEFDVAV